MATVKIQPVELKLKDEKGGRPWVEKIDVKNPDSQFYGKRKHSTGKDVPMCWTHTGRARDDLYDLDNHDVKFQALKKVAKAFGVLYG